MVKSILIFPQNQSEFKDGVLHCLESIGCRGLCVLMFLCLVDKKGQENARKFGCVLIFKIWVCVHSVLIEDEPRSKFMYFLNFNYVVFFFFFGLKLINYLKKKLDADVVFLILFYSSRQYLLC